MYLTPTSHIKIGNVTFAGVNEITATKSVTTGEATSTITLPRNFIKKENKGILDVIKKGDMVEVRIGYAKPSEAHKQPLEFKGYVKEISDTTPIKITCEDEWYPYRRENVKPKTYPAKCTAKDILQYAMPGFTVEAPDISIPTGYRIDAVSKFAVVESLRTSLGLSVRADFSEKKLVLAFAYDMKNFATHTYVFGTRKPEALRSLNARKLLPNVKKNDLKFESSERSLFITAISKQKAGKDVKVEVGNKDKDASKITRHFEVGLNESELRKRANEELKRVAYNGYTGNITGFGVPQTQAGDTLKLVDAENPEREGSYLIESVTINYAISKGFERVNKLSYKIG